jgi:hypothetical protein
MDHQEHPTSEDLQMAESDASFRSGGSPIGNTEFWLSRDKFAEAIPQLRADRLKITQNHWHGGNSANWEVTNGKHGDSLSVHLGHSREHLNEGLLALVMQALEESRLELAKLLSNPEATCNISLHGPGIYTFQREPHDAHVPQSDWQLTANDSSRTLASADTLEDLMKNKFSGAMRQLVTESSEASPSLPSANSGSPQTSSDFHG